MTALAYRVVDVFTDRPYAGNPLAVVLGGDALSTAQCQALAAEFNLSETAFPMASTAAADYRLRIFTPTAELPFAGHPSVGAAWVQRDLGAVDGPRVVQECGAGLLPLTFRPDGSIELTGGTASVGAPLDPVPLLAAAGLPASAGVAGRSTRAASTGNPFTYLPVQASALAAARPSPVVADALAGTGGGGLFLFSWDAGRVRARMFAPGLGVVEDPATGSAATALGAYLAAEGLVGDGETSYEISQGVEMGRPSTLHGTVVVEGGVAAECRVSGHVIPIAAGRIEAPA